MVTVRAPASMPELDLAVEPCIGAEYFHAMTETRLKVGAVGWKGPCGYCKGRGTIQPKLAPARYCERCEGTGRSRGVVVCYHPKDEHKSDLPLIWTIDEFLEAFRRADGRYQTGELF